MFRSSPILELALFVLCGTAAACAQTPALDAAVRRGDIRLAKQLIKTGADVNSPDEVGCSPLIISILADNREMALFLLQSGANVDARQRDSGETALWYATLLGRTDLAQILLESHARVDLRYAEDQTVLHLAASRGNAEIARQLLAAHAEVNSLDERGNSPLDKAVLQNFRDVVALLLDQHADFRRAQEGSLRTALHKACIKGFPEIARLLIQAGADPAARDNWDQTPLDLALAYHNQSVVSALLHLAPQSTRLDAAFAEAMETATRRGRTEVVETLLDCGWNVNRRTPEGSTYLNDAALRGQRNVVRLLLDRGARLDAKNQNGGTPLHDAALAGDTGTIALLLDRGAAIDSRDVESGATPLMLAASLGRTEAVVLLLKRGADPNLADRSGRTALARAKEGQDANLVKLLEGARGAQRVSQPGLTRQYLQNFCISSGLIRC